ncbi:MAG TPA: hypothetical protein PKY96_01510 [Flavobacteriales bacterium]|nr:hypothetical protein [Flavobacteriales bacterium]
MKRHLILLIALSFGWAYASAQGDLAYMPKAAPVLTADDERISMSDTDDPNIVHLHFPAATYRVDLLNSTGSVVDQFDAAEHMEFNVSELRPGTWTLRACTPQGFRVRRFVVHNRNGQNWVVESQPTPRKKR